MIRSDLGKRAKIALSLMALLASAACSTNRFESAGASPRSAVSPRSSRGNPVFYEVLGERYYVMSSAAGYRERGMASWYGRDFHGQPTSSGEIYDMYAMTAAHKTLPIPTWVEVTNLRNGRRITVKVNDRGPFVDGRIIDLSYRAARELDIIDTGTQLVEVRAIGASSAESGAGDTARVARSEAGGRVFSIISEAVADSVRPDDLPFEQLYIQLGAFAERRNAANLEAELKRRGFDNAFVVFSPRGHDALHRVRIGPLRDVADFDRVSMGLKALGFDGMHLVVE